MELNFEKCKCMLLSRNNFTAVSYLLGNHQLEIVDSFIDVLDTKLNFIGHITLTINKARNTLDFINPWAKEYSHLFITKQRCFPKADQFWNMDAS